MIIPQSEGRVISSGGGQTRSMQIVASAKAFEILSSGIYKDSKLAIVRELSTNAADSHIDAGRPDKPFIIDAPTWIDPTLVIRDFGTGMSEEKILTTFTRYFDSDKTTRNDVTGCLGLGSKAPFAYTDIFSVTSYQNGQKLICTLFKDPEVGPSLRVDSRSNTAEPDGVEIKIPIKSGDITEFHSNIRDVVRWFKVPPIVRGLEITQHTPVLSGDGWRIYNREDVDNSTMVVMGNVAYPIKLDEVNVGRPADPVPTYLFHGGLVIDIGIGEVDIQASRESLKVTTRTATALRKRLLDVDAAIKEKVQSQIDAATTIWQARLAIAQCFGHPILNSQCEGTLGGHVMEWRGMKLSDRIPVYSTLEHKMPASVYHTWTGKNSGRRRSRSGFMVRRSTDVGHIEARPNLAIFVDDLRIGGYARLAYHAGQFVVNEKEYHAFVFKVPSTDKGEFKLWLEATGLSEIIRPLSSLPQPPKSFSTGRRKATAQVLEPVDHYDDPDSWSPKEIDFDAGGIYVGVVGYAWGSGRFSGSGGRSLIAKIRHIQSILPDDFSMSKLVGVRSRQIGMFEKAKQWRRLEDVIDEGLKAVKPKDMIRLLAHERIHGSVITSMALELTSEHRIPKKSPLHQLARFIRPLAELASEDRIRVACELRNGNIDHDEIQKIVDRSEAMCKRVKKRYPMLGITQGNWRQEADKVASYIRLVDREVPEESEEPAAAGLTATAA